MKSKIKYSTIRTLSGLVPCMTKNKHLCTMLGPRESFIAGNWGWRGGEYAAGRRGAWVQAEAAETKLSVNPPQIWNRKQSHIWFSTNLLILILPLFLSENFMLLPTSFAMAITVTMLAIPTHAKHSKRSKKLIENLCPAKLIFPVSSLPPSPSPPSPSSSDPFILIKWTRSKRKERGEHDEIMANQPGSTSKEELKSWQKWQKMVFLGSWKFFVLPLLNMWRSSN